MMQKEKTLEEKIYLTWYEDGLIDIFTGIALLAIGLQMLFPMPYLMPVGMGVAFFWIRHTKEKVTDARLGKVTFSAERRKAIAHLRRVLTSFMWATIAIGVALYFLRDPSTGTTGFPKGVPLGVIMIVGMGIVARMVPLPRFGMYAVLFAGLLAVDILINMPLFYAFIVGGGIIVFIGAGDYSRFKTAHPIRKEGDDD